MNPNIPISRLRTSCADRNDALGWTAGQAFELDGYVLGLRSNHSQTLEFMLQHLPARAMPLLVREVDRLLSFFQAAQAQRRGQQNYHRVYVGCEVVERELDLQVAQSKFQQTLKELVIRYSSTRAYLQGSLLTWKDQAITVVGPSPARQAISAQLVAAGCAEIGEELIIVDDQGDLCSWCDRTQWQPGLVLKVAEQESNLEWKEISPGLATMEIFGHRSPMMVRQANQLLAAFGKLSQRSRCFQTHAGDAEVLNRLKSMLC